MKIITGLGNPGPKYETTRHNAGFLAVDRLIDEWKAEGPSYQYEGEIYKADIAGEKVLLIKPETYMNLSGKTVGPLFKFYKCQPQDLIVIHDEVDLGFGILRVKTGGGTAGHNGLKSIDAHLGADNNGYHRIRIGVGKSAFPGKSTADHVLDAFSDDELKQLDVVLDRAAKAAELLIRGEVQKAMTLYNAAEKSPMDKASKSE